MYKFLSAFEFYLLSKSNPLGMHKLLEKILPDLMFIPRIKIELTKMQILENSSLLIYQTNEKIPPCSFITACSFNGISEKIHPARLLQPARLKKFQKNSTLLVY